MYTRGNHILLILMAPRYIRVGGYHVHTLYALIKDDMSSDLLLYINIFKLDTQIVLFVSPGLKRNLKESWRVYPAFIHG